MKTGMYAILALTILVTGILLPPTAGADGHHHGNWNGNWHGHHHHGGDDFFYFSLGLVFPLLTYGYAYGYPYGYSYGYPYGYSYYGRPPIYVAPVQVPTPAPVTSRSVYTESRKEPAYCREYTRKIIVDGKEEMAYGTACLQDNGNWRIMN